MDSTYELQRIIDCGIRFSLSTIRKGGYGVKLGNYKDSPEPEPVFRTVDQAVSWLMGQIKLRYPESRYARRLRTRQLLLSA